MADDFRQRYLDDCAARFRAIKKQADGALAQISDERFFSQVDTESNSLAHLVKHMAGNIRSRWTDFLTTDGEKPDRKRDQEFEIAPADTREALLQTWEKSWKTLFDALEALEPEDLDRVVYIRKEPHTIEKAFSRQIAHLSYHAGQIVFLARHLAGPRWSMLSIPRGRSAAFNTEIEEPAGAPAADQER